MPHTSGVHIDNAILGHAMYVFFYKGIGFDTLGISGHGMNP
jgi:hypothetical protein